VNIILFLLLIIDPGFVYIPVIFLLLLYIAYLQYQLNKKKAFIASFLKKMIHLEKLGSKEEIKRIIRKLIESDFSFLLPKDKILDEDIVNYIFEEEDDAVIFIHYTRDEDVSDKILKEGFKFRNSFYKTAESVFRDKVDFLYKHSRHKQFGKYTVIITISKKVYDHYNSIISQSGKADVLIEQILTEKEPEMDENHEPVYTLPKQFIKGYINYEKGEIIQNPDFNYHYDSDKFKKNIQALK
jgi:hypothetical protein